MVGPNVQHLPFLKNRVMTVHAWLVCEEIIRYLKNMEADKNLLFGSILHSAYKGDLGHPTDQICAI